jgi:hypothetical protein
MTMTLQEQYEAKRKLNLDGKLSHDDFYCWLADEIGIHVSDLPVTLDVIRRSTDEHLNDIPLHKWDACDDVVRSKARRAGTHSWSLSNTVSTLKCFARREIRAK